MACGTRHGAAPDARGQIRASVEGKSGRVVRATPTGEHEHTALGRCVADVFERIRFAPFEAPRFGFLYSMRM